MYRTTDFFLAFIILTFSLPVFCAVFIILLITIGRPLFLQTRVGIRGEPFLIYKFRTLHLTTPELASDKLTASMVTKSGRFLRYSKLDELPQLLNVLRGDMSLVGPRPCLFSQSELVDERQRIGVLKFRPGITGLAQICGVDMSRPKHLSAIDAIMIKNLTMRLYLLLIFCTAFPSFWKYLRRLRIKSRGNNANAG
jgi:O-antigen biosynthesis protein WbqP